MKKINWDMPKQSEKVWRQETVSRRRRFLLRYHKIGVVGVMMLSVVFAFFLQLVLANGLATRGGEINDMEHQREQLMHDIALLKQEESTLQSMINIRSSAEKMGMKYNPEMIDYFGQVKVAYSE